MVDAHLLAGSSKDPVVRGTPRWRWVSVAPPHKHNTPRRMAHVRHVPCNVKPLLPPPLASHLPRLHPARPPPGTCPSMRATAASRLAPTTAKHASVHNTPSDQHPAHDRPMTGLMPVTYASDPPHATQSTSMLMFAAYSKRAFSSPVVDLRTAHARGTRPSVCVDCAARGVEVEH